MEVKNETLDAWRTKSRDSLFFFARAILGFKDLDPEIHGPLCRALEKCEDITRLMVTFPRTWFKSTVCSIAYPIWRSINNPEIRILIVQNSFSNACKKLGAIKSIFEKNDLFKALFPEILPVPGETWTRECLKVNRKSAHPEGTFEAAGVGTATTSRHYDEIIEDDTIAPKKDDMTGVIQQPTAADIEKAIGWHRQCHPLLIHPTKSRIIIVGTRWAEGDLQGWIMENSPEYVKFSRSIYENDLGEAVRPESGGHIVWGRFNEEVAKAIERDEGPYMFACLYMNTPTAAINQVFSRSWMKYYEEIKHRDMVYCTSVDLASAKKEESSDPDYTVVLTCAVSAKYNEIYVVHYTRGRFDPGETINAVFDHVRAYKPLEVIVESIGYQRTLNYWMRKRMKFHNLLFYINELKGLTGSKVDRIRGLQPYFSNGQIFLKARMTEIEQELLAFPKGRHDDLVDALSMQIKFWYGITESYTKEEEEELAGKDMTGASVIKELQQRVIDPRSYPYDVGCFGDFYRSNQKRDYIYN
jgi:predicted phage terminase large subunit-like protein